ncbi:hypothetical protein AC249_AIPGENE28750 [Exaiptasia diaphana]|nr:hypothetical protein AC249_AIPGENE28750 [Exaiptasia diaphana]
MPDAIFGESDNFEEENETERCRALKKPSHHETLRASNHGPGGVGLLGFNFDQSCCAISNLAGISKTEMLTTRSLCQPRSSDQASEALASVNPTTVYLKEDFGDLVLMPEIDGTFMNLQNNQTYEVEGIALLPDAQSSNNRNPFRAQTSTNTASYSASFSPVMNTSSVKKGNSFSLKVVLARMTCPNGAKFEFEEEDQAFVTISESTANVPYITSTAKTAFDKDIVLVTANGLPINDSSGTKGLLFWKVPSRKVYGVRREDIEGGRKRKRIDEAAPQQDQALKELNDKVDSLLNLLQAEHQLKEKLTEFLKCPICLSAPANLPIYISGCCEIMIGCVECVERWIGGDPNRTCPHCRAEGPDFMPVRVRGLEPIVQLLH